MTAMQRLAVLIFACAVSACVTQPPAPSPTLNIDVNPYDDTPFDYPGAPAGGMVEHPPIEPAEPSAVAPSPQAPSQPPSQLPPQPRPEPRPEPAPATAPEAAPPAATPPAVPAPVTPEPEDHALLALVTDLARYSALGADDVKRELSAVSQAFARQRTDANRLRLAMLYSLAHTLQDDLRALQLLEIVIKNTPGSPGVRQLAGVLLAQVNERVRAVREEQQKAEAAVQKLERLRELERNLLRDRLRSGGSVGGGGGSGSGGSGGGR